ncbi:MAG: hypothetical protein Q8L24_02345 [bacterium]|nr:hypothetical protein [bacterium]
MNKKNLVLAVIVVVLVAIGIWYVAGSKKEAVVIPADNSGAIVNDLNSIDVGDINNELSDVNAAVNGL